MLNIVNKIKLNGSVLDLKVSKDTIIAVDNLYYVYILDSKRYQFTKTTSLSKTHEHWHRYANSFAVSFNNLANIPLLRTSKSIIIECKDKISKKVVLNWHKTDLSSAMFSDDSRFFATGGEDGKTVIYSLPTFNILTALNPKPDYISNINFSSDSKLIAISAFDKSTTVFDLERNFEVCEFNAHDIVEKCDFFDKNNKLFFVCKDGKSGVFDIENKKLQSMEKISNIWLTAMTLTNDKRYALCGGKDDLLYFIRLEDNKLLYTEKVNHIGISYLRIFDKRLFVGYIDGVVEIIDCDKYLDELEVVLKVDNFHEAREIAEKNVFLKIHPELTDRLASSWSSVLKNVIDLIAKNKIDEAIKEATPFIDDPVRNEEFSHYMSQRDNVGQFLDAVEDKNIIEAYALAEKYPEIKKLRAFDELEEYWQKMFSTAKKLLSMNPNLNVNKATEILKPFATIRSKKELVLTLLRNSDKYFQADQALKSRNFVEYFRLAERFPFLKETDIYKKTLMIGEQLVDKVSILEGRGDYEKAIEFGKILSNMAPFKKVAISRIRFIERKVSFLEAFKNKDIIKAYSLIESASDLKGLPEFSELVKLFQERSEKALNHAFAGYPKDAYSALEEYHRVDYWADKIGSIMKIAYLNEIKHALETYDDGDIDWAKTLSYYVDRYSKDDEIEKICEDGGIKYVLDNIGDSGDSNGYQKLEYIDTILAFSTDEE